MAHPLTDTVAAEGSGESCVEADISTWLQKNRLKKFKQYFEENEVLIEDLLTYNEDDMNDIITESGVTATAYKKRFKSAVRALQFKDNKSNINYASNQIYRIVLTPKESSAIQILVNKSITIKKSIENNKSETDKLVKNAKDCENNITSLFVGIRNELNKREKQLLTKLNNIFNEENNKLENNRNILIQYQNAVNGAQKEQNSLTLDPNIDSSKRETKIINLSDNTINKINNQNMHIKMDKISFIINEDLVAKYICNIGMVSTKPNSPILRVSEITDDAVKVTMECKTNTNEDEVSYKLEYKIKAHPNNYVDVDDEKKVEWIAVNVRNHKNGYNLKKLKSNTKYEIRSKYKILERDLWSSYSEIVQFQTQKCQHKWDPNCKSTKTTINGDVLTVNVAGWGTNWLQGVVSNGRHVWKFKIVKSVDKYSDFIFGVTNENNTKKKEGYWNKLCYWSMYGENKSYTYDANGSVCDFERIAKENDIITMCLDFDTKTLQFAINDESIGNSVAIQDGSYRAAVSLYHKTNAVKIL